MHPVCTWNLGLQRSCTHPISLDQRQVDGDVLCDDQPMVVLCKHALLGRMPLFADLFCSFCHTFLVAFVAFVVPKRDDLVVLLPV